MTGTSIYHRLFVKGLEVSIKVKVITDFERSNEVISDSTSDSSEPSFGCVVSNIIA